MDRAEIEIRVRYAETDQMAVAHHSNYFAWMEAARAELLRTNGLSYKELEEKGFLLPVKEAYCRYRKSLHYDDVIRIDAHLEEIGGASIKIGYTIQRKGDHAIAADGYTLHPFTNRSGRVVKIPLFFRKLFGSF